MLGLNWLLGSATRRCQRLRQRPRSPASVVPVMLVCDQPTNDEVIACVKPANQAVATSGSNARPQVLSPAVATSIGLFDEMVGPSRSGSVSPSARCPRLNTAELR